MTPILYLKLFGSPQITYQAQPLNGFISAKVSALLIYLAVTARPHSRDHLAHLLWSDTPASMKVNLRKALSNLRGLIGDLLVEDGKELVWLDRDKCWVDVDAFDQQSKNSARHETTELYQADFLSGFNISVSYEFEAWALGEQSRLKSQMVDLLRRLAIEREANGDLNEAISATRRLLALEPWHEEAHRQLMALLAKNGQRSAALAHFEVCKKVLLDELGVAPDVETRKLVEQIQHATRPTQKPRTKLPTFPKPEFPLIGRDNEWQTIQQAWQDCLTNGAHFVCIAGEAGIGKTRLTEEARLWVTQQGYASVYARSYAAEGALAYSPVVDWLRSEAIHPMLEQLDAVWLNDVVRLLPELLTEHPQLSPPKPITDGWQRRQFFEALARAITASGQPMLLVIDDLQWCDRETLEWLRFLLRFETKQPILVIGAYRIEEVEPDHAVFDLLVSLRQTAQVTEFEIRMLNTSETRKLVKAVVAQEVVDDELLLLYQETSGHPLFVIESLRNRQSEITNQVRIARQNQHSDSPKIQHVIQARLARLSGEARKLAEVAAAIGRAFTPQLLIQASKQEENSILQHLDELWHRRIIIEQENGQFDFSHDRVRETVYETISPFRRQNLHLQAANALELLYANNLSEWNVQIAMHYQNAGKLDVGLSYLINAVDTLIQRWAANDALVLITHTLMITKKLPLTEANLRHILYLRKLQYIALFDKNGYLEPQLVEINLYIEQIGRMLNDHIAIHLSLTYKLFQHMLRAEWISAKILCETYLSSAKHLDNPKLISRSYIELARVYYSIGDLTISKLWYDKGVAIIDTLDLQPQIIGNQPPQISPYVNCSHCYCLLGYLEQSRQRLEKALAIAKSSQIQHAIIETLNFKLVFLFLTHQNNDIQIDLEQMDSIAKEYNFPFYVEMSKLYQGWIWIINENYEEGFQQIKQTIAYFEQRRYGLRHTIRLGMLIECYRMAHRYKEGIATIQEALEFAERTSDLFWVPELYRLQGELLLGSGAEIHQVKENYQKSLEISRKQGSRLLELRTSVSLARLWQQQDKQTEAYQLLAPSTTGSPKASTHPI